MSSYLYSTGRSAIFQRMILDWPILCVFCPLVAQLLLKQLGVVAMLLEIPSVLNEAVLKKSRE
ncbi:MAG: hypothetical protein GY703_05500 [Gammaproteobacteria bacterium]|nr:hypothetical protein [Gammaproteobacteria bacterium]